LILCALMNLTISAPFTNLWISILLRILHILSILIGPNIFLSNCLSKIRRLFPCFHHTPSFDCLLLYWKGIFCHKHCATS
jgi:hypothetical protein